VPKAHEPQVAVDRGAYARAAVGDSGMLFCAAGQFNQRLSLPTMRYLWMTLLVLSPAILYGIALIAVGIANRFYRSRCPECQQRGLKMIDFIKATVLINGHAPRIIGLITSVRSAVPSCAGIVSNGSLFPMRPFGGKDNPPTMKPSVGQA
jgi:hypothetical protein